MRLLLHLGASGLQGPAWPLDVVIILISCTLLCCGWFKLSTTQHSTGQQLQTVPGKQPRRASGLPRAAALCWQWYSLVLGKQAPAELRMRVPLRLGVA